MQAGAGVLKTGSAAACDGTAGLNIGSVAGHSQVDKFMATEVLSALEQATASGRMDESCRTPMQWHLWRWVGSSWENVAPVTPHACQK